MVGTRENQVQHWDFSSRFTKHLSIALLAGAREYPFVRAWRALSLSIKKITRRWRKRSRLLCRTSRTGNNSACPITWTFPASFQTLTSAASTWPPHIDAAFSVWRRINNHDTGCDDTPILTLSGRVSENQDWSGLSKTADRSRGSVQ